MSLTIAEIKAAPVGARLKDGTVPGLHLRVFPSSRAFYLFFRTKTGIQRCPKIGDFPLVNLQRAREIARDMLLEVAGGGDPVADRAAAKSAPLFAEVFERYMREYALNPKHKKASSAAQDRRLGDRFLVPEFGKVRIGDVAYEAIEALHGRMKRTPVQANRAIALLSTILNLSEKWKLRPLYSNPCKLVKPYPEKARKVYLEPEHCLKVAEQLKAYETSRPAAVAFIYLLIYTGARCGEIAAARWDWLDGNVLRLPDSKTGEKPVYLPGQVIELLARLPRTEGGTLTGIKSPEMCWREIRKKADIPNVTLHDLRRTFASAALSAGVSLSQVGELLGHRTAQTTKGYSYLMNDAALAAANVAADRLESMLTASVNPARANALDLVGSNHGAEAEHAKQ